MLPPAKSCPRLWGKWHEVPKGVRLKTAECRELFPPQLRLRSAERWLEYGRLAALPLAILPIPPDSPLAASPTGRARLESPVSRWRLLVQYKLGVQCRTPSRSDRFNGVTGGAGGPKGRNRNLPWPPCKKGYIVSLFSFVYVNPSVHSLTLMSTSPFRAGLIRVLPTKKTTLRLSFFSLYSSLPLGAITTRRLGSSPSLYVVT